MSGILPTPTTGTPRSTSFSSTVGPGVGEGEVLAVVGADVAPRRPDERARDDPRHAPGVEQPPRGAAPGVERLERHRPLVRGDLEDRVGRGVDDGLAGALVLLAQLPDDLGPARGAVREDPGDAGGGHEGAPRSRAGSRRGKVASPSCSTIPIISQWPVMVSLPCERSAIRPWNATGRGVGRDARRWR